MSKLELICDGDSWVFGCEIVDPNISGRYDKSVHPGHYDYIQENDKYRIPRIFPTHLAKMLNANLTNLSWPADDNGTILNRTIAYITENYIDKKISTDNLFVIVGWSSLERNFFWYKDENNSMRFRIWTHHEHFDVPNQKKLWDYYVEYLWNNEEYLPRYIMNVLQLQNFFKINNIKWLCFNSFYQVKGKNPNEWTDLDIKCELSKLKLDTCKILKNNENFDNERIYYTYNYEPIWNTIDPIRFYKKNESDNTFRSFMEKESSKPYIGWHPSPESHMLWAEELFGYINKNNLL